MIRRQIRRAPDSHRGSAVRLALAALLLAVLLAAVPAPGASAAGPDSVGLVDLAGSLTAAGVFYPGSSSGCPVLLQDLSAPYVGSPAAGAVDLELQLCVDATGPRVVDLAGTFQLTTGVGGLSGSVSGNAVVLAPGSFDTTLTITSATGSFSGTTGRLYASLSGCGLGTISEFSTACSAGTMSAVPPPRALVAAGLAAVAEGNTATTTLDLPVMLSSPSFQTVVVQYDTVQLPGDRPTQADPGTDYTSTFGEVTFAPGQTVATVPIVVHGDTLVEPDEYIVVRLHDPTNAAIGGFWGLGVGLVTNDD